MSVLPPRSPWIKLCETGLASSQQPAHHHLPWWKRAVIYQIYPLSFQDTNADGKGDLGGILSRLDYLEWLQIDALWLGPIYPSPMVDFGYDISDFKGVDPVFGSLDDLDRLTDALHSRDIRLILDFVPNHTSAAHPWFRESRSCRQSSKRDWYIWADPAPNGGPPNNWLSRFGGSAWEWDPATGQYYYHAFLKEQPDLNWRNPEVRAEMAEVMRFWLRRGIDGFRLDAAGVLAEDEFLRDDPPNLEANSRTPPPEHLKRLYTDSQPEVLDWLAQLRSVVDEFPDRVLLAEVDTSQDKIPPFYGDKDRPIIDLPLNYRLLDTSWTAHELSKMLQAYYKSLPEDAWPDWVIGSHDKKRIASVIGSDQARIAAMLLFTLWGTPIFYAGDELGMRGGVANAARVLDPFEQRVPGYGLNRDPERSPMQWNGALHAGFTTGTPWLPLAPDYDVRNVEGETVDPNSLLALYRRLIALRRTEPALSGSGFTILPVQNDIISYARTDAAERLIVVLNVSAQETKCRMPGIADGEVLLSTHHERIAGILGEDEIVLRACEGVIIRARAAGSDRHRSGESSP